MLPCKTCAYRDTIPGNAHIRCAFDWSKQLEELPKAASIRSLQWFRFPFNYDPLWGPDTCTAHATERDPAKVAPKNPIADLLSLMG